MYKRIEAAQISFYDFNQELGFQLSEENEWVQLAQNIPWDDIEVLYQERFPSKNPYLQFFIGLPRFQTEAPFRPQSLVNFRKRMDCDLVNQVNERILSRRSSNAEAEKSTGTYDFITDGNFSQEAYPYFCSATFDNDALISCLTR